MANKNGNPNWKKGTSGNPAGRPKGAQDKITRELKEAFALLLQNKLGEFEGWLERVAETDPAKAIDLAIKLSERFVPALARQEITGADGKDLNMTFNFGDKLTDHEDSGD